MPIFKIPFSSKKISFDENELMILDKKNNVIIRDAIEKYVLTHYRYKESKMTGWGGKSLEVTIAHPSLDSPILVNKNGKDIDLDDVILMCDYLKQKGTYTEKGYWKSAVSGVKAEKRVSQPIQQRNGDKEFYEELKKLPGFDSWGTKKEIKYLRTMLLENEEVLAIASGIIEGNTWLITCTTRRIIFVDCGMIYGVKHAEVLLDKINAVSFKNGIVLGEIHIEDGANNRIITNVSKNSTKPFVEAVHKAIDMERKSGQKQANNYSISKADEILKFKQLLDAGIITQEEFEQQKRQLLEPQ